MSNSRVTRVIDTLVSKAQNSKEFSKLDPRVRTVLNGAVEKASGELSPIIVDKVDSASNFLLNEIPAKAIGPFNPLDLTSGKLGPTEVSGTLKPVIDNTITKELSGRVSNEVFDKLNEELPDSLKSFVDLNVVSNEITKVLSDATSTGISDTLNSFTENVMGTPINIPPLVNDIASAFIGSGFDTDATLKNLKKQATGVIAQKAINKAKDFKVLSNENKEKLVVQSRGFIDPTGTYPTKFYVNESETNKLARGEVLNTIVQLKEKDRVVSSQLPNDESFPEPPSCFKGEYPFNKVTETESGHIIEVDDTPNAERLHIFHKSGTFIEIDAFGNVNKKTKGSDYQFVEKNGFLSIKGDLNVSIGKGVKIFVGGDADIEIKGDTNLTCRNDITMQAAGRIDMSATEEINLYSANINMHANTNVSIKGEKDAFITGNNIYTLSNVSTFNQAGTNFSVKTGDSIFYECDTNNINLKAGGFIYSDAPEIRMNEGKAEVSPTSLLARSSNIGDIGIRESKEEGQILDAFPVNYLDQFIDSEDAEDESVALSEYDFKNRSGLLSEDFGTDAVAEESSSPNSSINTVIKPEDFVLKQTFLPENFQLSPNFTLGSLSTKAAFPHDIVAQKGFSYGDIVFNLQGVALNILEPAFSMFPNLIITSGFRPLSPRSSPTSDHLVGKAVDLQFKGVNKSEYFEIAEILATNLNYDKLLLEYKDDGTGNPWIHFSFDVNRQRKIILTYNNHIKFSEGLSKLA